MLGRGGRRSGATSTDDDKADDCIAGNCYKDERGLTLDKEHIDLIVSDVMMSRMDGYALTRELRGSKYILPILMITAKDSMEDMEKGFLAGTDDYMVKHSSHLLDQGKAADHHH